MNRKAKILADVGYNPKRDERIKSLDKFVLDDSQLPQRLDHALGKIKIDKKYLRYYGARINETILKKVKSKMVPVIQSSPAIILETGEIMTENNKPEDVNFVFDSTMTLKNNRWSLKSIRDFCTEEIDIENYTFDMVFNNIRKLYKESMVFDDELWYDVLALRDLRTYFWDLIDKFLIIKHEGMSGTAKSKGMKIGANLSFNGKKFLCPTPANFFRYRHSNKATIFIEEAEKLFDNSKNNSANSDLVEYLNGSYEKGNTVPRQNDKDINQTDEFDPAGDTALGAIAPLKGALKKRSIPLHMIKAAKNDNRGNVEVPTESDLSYSSIRDKIYICGLLNYRDYEEALKIVGNNYELVNRQWNLAKPLIALASCINPELENKVGNFLSKLFEIRDDSFNEDSWEISMARTLVKIYCLYDTDTFLNVEELKEKFISEISSDTPTQYKINNTKIGILISKLGFTKFKANPTGGKRGYRASFFDIIDVLIRQEIFKIENVLKIVSEVSGCKYNEIEITKWYADAYLASDILVNENEKESDTLTPITLVSTTNKKVITMQELEETGLADEYKEILTDNDFFDIDESSSKREVENVT